MSIEKIVNEAIPIPANACRLIRSHKEWQRRVMTERIEQGKELHLVPDKVLKKCQKYLANNE
jgi:hypothetical protein